MGPILAMAVKDLRLLVRDRAGFFFTFCFPLIFAVFFGVIFSGGGRPRAIGLAVVDEDGSPRSRAFVERLSAGDALDVTRAATRDEAVALVRAGKRTAFLRLPAGFGDTRSTLLAGQPARVELGCDPARRAEAGMLQGVVAEAFFASLTTDLGDPAFLRDSVRTARARLLGAPDLSAGWRLTLTPLLGSLDQLADQIEQDTAGSGASEPGAGAGGGAAFRLFEVQSADVTPERRTPPNAFTITFPQAIVWGMLGCTVGFAVSLAVERRSGTLMRLCAAPVSWWQVLAGKCLGCLCIVLVVSAMLVLVARVGFGVRPGSLGMLAAAVLASGLCFLGIMVLMASLARTEAAAGGVGNAVLMVLAMIGGGMVPLTFMPEWLVTIGHVSPVKWSILALEGAVWRGFSAEQFMLPAALLVGIGAGCFALGAWQFRRARAD